MIQKKILLIACLLLVVGNVSVAYGQQVDTSFVDLDQKIALWMKEWHVPGMAVGIARKDTLLLCKGYGVRNVETGQLVTPKTVFSIASISKAFTGLSAALLVDSGKLEWDQPVVEIVPEFMTADSLSSRETTIRDMLCHRTGLPEHFMLYDVYPSDRERLFNSLQYSQPAFGFRQTYHYNNVVFAAAGYIVGHIAGMTWEDFVQKSIFDPLGMDNASFGLNIEHAGDIAYPHDFKNGSFRVNSFRDTESTNPAGGINASLDDLLKWLDLYLNGGKIGEKRLISRKNLEQTYTPHIINKFVPWSTTNPMAAYGLGWNVEVYRSRTFVNHGGTLSAGYACWVAWLPREDIKIAILSNANTMLPYYLAYILTDKLVGVDISYWDAILAEKTKDESDSEESAPEPTATIPPTLVEQLQGIYSNPAYGKAEVVLADTTLTIRFGERVQIPLSYANDSTLKALYLKYDYPFELSLTRNGEGRVISFEGNFCPWEPVEFRRVSD